MGTSPLFRTDASWLRLVRESSTFARTTVKSQLLMTFTEPKCDAVSIQTLALPPKVPSKLNYPTTLLHSYLRRRNDKTRGHLLTEKTTELQIVLLVVKREKEAALRTEMCS